MSTCEQFAGDFELPETARSEFKGANFLSAAGIKGDMRKLEQLATSFDNDPLTLELLSAYLRRWFAGRLNGLESIPVLYDKNPDKRPLRRVLAAFENKLSGASDMTLLYLLSLSDQPVPQQPMKLVFRSTLVERWLTRRDDYVRFLGPLGRLNEDHWHWVIENLRRLKLLEPATSGQHDRLLVPEPVRAYFRSELKLRHPVVYEQALVDMEKLFKETVVSLYEKVPDRPVVKTWTAPDYQPVEEAKSAEVTVAPVADVMADTDNTVSAVETVGRVADVMADTDDAVVAVETAGRVADAAIDSVADRVTDVATDVVAETIGQDAMELSAVAELEFTGEFASECAAEVAVDTSAELKPVFVLWEETELDAAREQLLALRQSMASLREHSLRLQQHLQQLRPSV